MKCIFEIDSKTTLSESAEKKHQKLVSFLKTLDAPWGIQKDVDIQFPGFGREFVATSNLGKFLGNGIKMWAFYRYRNRLEDNQLSDDRVYIEFNPKKIDYLSFVTIIFPQFVTSFGAYSAEVFDKLLIYKNFEEKRLVDRRKIINRVYPISFYEAKLCEATFRHSPKKIAKILDGHFYKVEEFYGGILIIANTKPFSIEESIDFENKVKALLNY